MSEIERLHDETARLMQRSLDANLLSVAYLLDMARLELHRQLQSAPVKAGAAGGLEHDGLKRSTAAMH